MLIRIVFYNEIFCYNKKSDIEEVLMKKTALANAVLLFFIILILSSLGYPKELEVRSTWAPSPLRIDGSDEDWAEAGYASIKKLNLDYSFRNDSENLYVLLIFKDPQYLSSISYTGMTLWFNTEGKKKKNYGILFIQKKISAENLISRLEKEKGSLPEEKKNEIRANPSYLLNHTEIVDKKSKSHSQSSESSEIQPAVFMFRKQQGSMVFEFSIPLKNMTAETSPVRAEVGKSIKVGFEWGGMTKEMREAQRQMSASLERSRSVDNDPTSDRAGAAGSSMPMGLVQGPKKYGIWMDVQLAQSQ